MATSSVCEWPGHSYNQKKLLAAAACDDALETSTVADDSDFEEASSKQRWADLVDTDEEGENEAIFRLTHWTSPVATAAAVVSPTGFDSNGNSQTAIQSSSGLRQTRWADLAESDEEKTVAIAKPFGHSALPARSVQTIPDSVPVSKPNSDSVAHASRTIGVSRARGEHYSSKPKRVEKDDSARLGKGSGKAASRRSGRSRKGAGKGASDKLQCQFIVGIEEDIEFGVVRRVIGRHGANMKSIVEKTGVKLRLRGRGSKFLEGPQQQESLDDLMLCLSGQDKAGFDLAKDLVSDILLDVYWDYASHCRQSGGVSPVLKIQVHEGYREGSA